MFYPAGRVIIHVSSEDVQHAVVVSHVVSHGVHSLRHFQTNYDTRVVRERAQV